MHQPIAAHSPALDARSCGVVRRPRRVLVCDDDATTRLILRRVLERDYGADVLEACSGMDALNLLVTETVDLLVLDLSMPGLDGAETLEAIRACPGIQGLPVIVLTTERRGAAVAHIVNLGVSDFMLKPLHGARTRARMTAVMSQLLSSPD